MKVLFLTTQFPYPLDNGGKIGAYNGISVVSQGNDVVVLSFTEEPQYIEEGLRFFLNKFPNTKFEIPLIHDIHIRNKPIKLARVMLKNYLKSLPYVTAKFEDFDMYKKIDNMFSNTIWDIVFIDYLNMNVYADYIRSKYRKSYTCMVLKNHNIEYELIKQVAENSKALKKLILNAEWKRTLIYERKAIKNADLVYSVCNENTEFMKEYNNNSFTMLPTFEIKKITRNFNCNHKILFMGNLSWGANMEGLKWFVERVFPIIKKTISDVKLTVIGSGPVVNPFNGIKSVEYRGYVKDVSSIYAEHSVFIVPLFKGSGIRIKILEAFNNEIPVVSTTLGCKTIGASHNIELIIADNELVFAEGVISLLQEKNLNYQMRKNAKKFLEDFFTLEKRQKEFAENIRNTIVSLEEL